MVDAAGAPGWAGIDASESAFWTVHQGDARDVDNLLSGAAADKNTPFLQTTITSPPYATLVDYGSDNQIGFGQSYEDYLESCKSIFQSLYRWTLDTGSMWVVADSLLERRPKKGKPSRLVPLPFELAAQAESVGWILREVVIWRKDRTRPWSHRGKLRNGFEYVLFFVKSNNYVFNEDRLRDTGNLKSWWVKYPERHNPWGMSPDNVWEIPIPVQGSWNDAAFRHACPFPPELVRRMVLLSSNEGDVVFDPFAGSGSVVNGATREGRKGLGLELNQDYVARFHDQVRLENQVKPEPKPVGLMTQRLLELRMLKYPKELAKQLLRGGFTSGQINAVLMDVKSVNYKPARTSYGAIECSVIIDDGVTEADRERLLLLLQDVMKKAPLSKYGLEAECGLVRARDVERAIDGKDVSVYTKGRTWYADLVLPSHEVEGWIRQAGTPTVVPVLSPLHVQQSLEESL
ncbi:DNA-methyltransferase [Leucobacter sp. 1207-22]|uniref:DNA-methyltransferase n=1 Tax=Leucobacter sp. 1207-22 TaxID=2604456 RepID=UPI00406436C2